MLCFIWLRFGLKPQDLALSDEETKGMDGVSSYGGDARGARSSVVDELVPQGNVDQTLASSFQSLADERYIVGRHQVIVSTISGKY